MERYNYDIRQNKSVFVVTTKISYISQYFIFNINSIYISGGNVNGDV